MESVDAVTFNPTYMPPAVTEIAKQVDSLYGFLLIASLISFVILIGGMSYFVWRYRRKTATDQTAYITHDSRLEFLWSFVPLVIFMFVFAWGWIIFHDMRDMPEEALEIHVFAKKWDWRFVYKSGLEITSSVDSGGNLVPPTMVVPKNHPVKLIMASERMTPGLDDPSDRPVLHSFYVPAFRIKQDVVPGRFTSLWFEAKVEGEYWAFCTEWCGPGHYNMSARIRVVDFETYEEWLRSASDMAEMTVVERGAQLSSQAGCLACHNLDGRPGGVGPSFRGVWMTERQFTDGNSSIADADYIYESIVYPDKDIVVGYSAGIMPPNYADQLSEEEILAIVEFIKSLE